jgi:hypothetical protein
VATIAIGLGVWLWPPGADLVGQAGWGMEWCQTSCCPLIWSLGGGDSGQSGPGVRPRLPPRCTLRARWRGPG